MIFVTEWTSTLRFSFYFFIFLSFEWPRNISRLHSRSIEFPKLLSPRQPLYYLPLSSRWPSENDPILRLVKQILQRFRWAVSSRTRVVEEKKKKKKRKRDRTNPKHIFARLPNSLAFLSITGWPRERGSSWSGTSHGDVILVRYPANGGT